MKISEVSRRTGLTKRAIRYYFLKEGLISPQLYEKSGREFRDYSEADLRLLEAIAGLRRAGFSINQIRTVISNPEQIPQLWRAYIAALKELGARLALLLETAKQVDESKLTDLFAMSEALAPATRDMPLPNPERGPRFRYLDDLPVSRKSQERDRLQYKQTRYVQPANILNTQTGTAYGLTIDPGFLALGTRAFEFVPFQKRTSFILSIILVLIVAAVIVLYLLYSPRTPIPSVPTLPTT